MSKFDLIILSNGPGEITTWVLPVVRQIRGNTALNQENLRISLILSPCPHSTGNEGDIVALIPEIDRFQCAKDFFPFLLWGKTVENWSWHPQGLVLFLGGDQFYTLVIAKRLKYQSLIYAEWDARWYRYIDYFAVMNQRVIEKIPANFHYKFTVIGDLMADLPLSSQQETSVNNTIYIGLLPGSKSSKLTQGVPFLSAIAQYLSERKNNVEFIIPLAPTITPEILVSYGKKENNNFIDKLGGITTELREENQQLYLETSGGLKIKLITEFPCYDILAQCQLALTTVGANTAQLAALNVPMIVLIPTYQLTAMKSWDGLPGILVNLPMIGNLIAKIINKIVVAYTAKNKKLYAWPNIWAKREVIPELMGSLTVEEVGDLALDFINHPTKLAEIKSNLQQLRGEEKASEKIANMIVKLIPDIT